MKLKYIFYCIVLSCLTSCSDDFLDETPQDFLAAENAFQTYDDFNLSLVNLYSNVRSEFYTGSERHQMDFIYGTDLVFDGQPNTNWRWTPYSSVMRPDADKPQVHWENFYKIIAEANMVISRLDNVELAEEQEIKVEAEARFFRSFAYRTLAYLYGGVPLVLEEATEPRFDYTRASRDEVLRQSIADATFAAENLAGITETRDGEINNLAAYHLLAELYLAVEEPQNAIQAATQVIDDPNTALMSTRFGSRSNEEPGDVYWDLFRRNNQNRSSGNTEGIWVIQFETDIPGGGMNTTNREGALYERHHAPLLQSFPGFLWPNSDYSGGRGIGWAVSTKYFSNEIWESDWENDIRNANHNFVREYVYNDPNSPLYGQIVSTENPPAGVEVPSRAFYAYQSKVTTPYNHPEELYADLETGELKSTAGATYTDQYMFRLPETYLLRAEAYMKAQNLAAAAADINEVRVRSNALPVAPGEIDIDYILDERMRELGVEEKRRLTLMRLGLLYDRVTRYNPYYETIQEHYNLWPVPFSEIERNTEAELQQNPGYPQS